MPTGAVALDTSQYVKVNVGFNTTVLQAHRDSVRIVVSELQPSINNTAFHLLGGDSPPLKLPFTDTNVWALAQSDRSSLISTELENPKTALVGAGGDWLTEVSKGNVPGHTAKITLAATVITTPNVVQNVWGDGGSTDYERPTVAETWEIISDSTEDRPSGTGAGFVLVISLDDDYVEQSQFVTMNGNTAAVTLTGTHFRPVSVIVIGPTGTANTNVGNITLRSSSGKIRNIVPVGQGSSRDAIYTVPAGKTILAMLQTWTFEKNDDGIVTIKNQGPLETDPKFSFGNFPGYQDKTQFRYQVKPLLGEKSDLIHFVESPNASAVCNVVMEFIEVDNEYIA